MVKFDRTKSEEIAKPVLDALHKQFGKSYFNATWTEDGVKVTYTGGPDDGEAHEDNPNVLSPQNISKVIGPFLTSYRAKGYIFTQPVSKAFYIGAKGMSEMSFIRKHAGLPIIAEANETTHFGLENEANVAKVTVTLAKAGFTIDMEFAIGFFYFNFKDIKTTEKALAIAKRTIDKSKESEWN